MATKSKFSRLKVVQHESEAALYGQETTATNLLSQSYWIALFEYQQLSYQQLAQTNYPRYHPTSYKFADNSILLLHNLWFHGTEWFRPTHRQQQARQVTTL